MIVKPLRIDVVSDVVCPWCYIGKRRLERARQQLPEQPLTVHWRPYFLNPWVPAAGMDRDAYLTAKFGSVESYRRIAGGIAEEAAAEGLSYRPELVQRQPNTLDCHRLIHWAAELAGAGTSAAMKQRLMELYFRDGGDLTDREVLLQAAADCALDRAEMRRRLASDLDVALVTAQAKDAAERGISGVPTFVFGRRYALTGAQPAEQLVRAIRHVAAEQNAEDDMAWGV
jgi:predicted DsbA family dithiol-disulfide isomerase